MTDWIDMTDVIVDLVERNGWEPAPVIEIPDEYESAAAAPLAVEVPAAASAAPTLAAIPYCSPLEVAASTADRPEWLVPGYIALQAITELDGKIKSSGKTTWATHLVAAVLDGANFMGQPTTKTRVTYVTEQTQGSFREALSRAGLIGRGDELRLVFRREVGAMRWRDLIAAVVADAKRDGYGLLVIDTWASWPASSRRTRPARHRRPCCRCRMPHTTAWRSSSAATSARVAARWASRAAVRRRSLATSTSSSSCVGPKATSRTPGA